MNVIKKTIKQGITLNYVFCDKFTTNNFTIHFFVPLTEEGASCYSLLSRVLKKGCAAYPTQEALNSRLEELYSSSVSAGVSKLGECESFFISVNMLDDRFTFDGISIEEGTMRMAFEILFRPLLVNGCFDETIVSREKKAQINRIKALINNKSSYAFNRCREEMCAGEVYALSVIGKEDVMEKIDSAMLYHYYLKLLNEARVEIVYNGNKSIEDVLSGAHLFLEELRPRLSPELKTEIIPSKEKVRSFTERVAATQGNLVMGFRTGCGSDGREEAAFRLFESIYGSSPVSKLFMNVRERLSLCYHCSTRRDVHKGVMYVVAGIENANLEITKAEILAQLEEIRQGHVTENEMMYAKEALLDSLRSVEDDQDAMDTWCFHRLLRPSIDTPSVAAAQIKDLTVSDVVDVAQKITLDLVYFLEGMTAKEGSHD